MPDDVIEGQWLVIAFELIGQLTGGVPRRRRPADGVSYLLRNRHRSGDAASPRPPHQPIRKAPGFILIAALHANAAGGA